MEHSLLFNLVEFDHDVLRPSASAFSRALSRRRRAYCFSDLVAGYFWLIFGLDAEYFPEGHAASLFGQRFVQFVTEFQDLYSRFGYIFDPEFGPLLLSACNLKRPIQRDEALRVHGDPVVQAAIRSALIAEGTLRQSAAAQTFMSLLSFEPDLLRRVMSEGQAKGSSDEGPIGQSMIVSDEGPIGQGTIVLGFQDVVSYMRVFVDLSHALQQEQLETFSRRCDFRLRQLTRWRVNRHTGIDGPFKDVALFVNEKVLNGAYTHSQVSDEIDELLENWGFTHLKIATA
jgi:hypothetical protein